MILVIGIIVLVVALIIVGIVVSIKQRAKRVAAYTEYAQTRGWAFIEKDRSMPAEFHDFGPFGKGSNRYCQWVLDGRHDDVPFRIFDYHYETHSTDSKGNRTTRHHHHKVGALHMDLRAPDLTIVPEHVFHKIGDALGGEDIDFESDEFSRKFWVKCKDRKFAYDVVTPDMMQFLLANRGWKIEWRGRLLMIWMAGNIRLHDTEPMLALLSGLRSRVPRHLHAEASN